MGLYKNNNGDLELIAGTTLYADSPVGTIIAYGGATAPVGWLLCNGSAVSRANYAELFAVIGTAFGAGDGSTTFNLPDGREATLKGAGLTGLSNNHIDSNGILIGEFIDDQLQDHTHSIGVRTNVGGTTGPGWHYLNEPVDSIYNSQGVTSSYRKGNTTEVKAIGVNWIIKAKQTGVPKDIADLVEWKKLGVYTGTSAISLPTNWKEAHIFAMASDGTGDRTAICLEVTFHRETLSALNKENLIVSSSRFLQSEQQGCGYKFTDTTVELSYFQYQNGTSVASNSKSVVYYR